MSEAAKLQLQYSVQYSRPFHSNPLGVTFVLINKPSLKRDTGAANSAGADVPGCWILDRSAKEYIRGRGYN